VAVALKELHNHIFGVNNQLSRTVQCKPLTLDKDTLQQLPKRLQYPPRSPNHCLRLRRQVDWAEREFCVLQSA